MEVMVELEYSGVIIQLIMEVEVEVGVLITMQLVEVVVVERVDRHALQRPLVLQIRVVVVVDVCITLRLVVVVLEFVFLHGSPKNNK
jgi:hypothetical protein